MAVKIRELSVFVPVKTIEEKFRGSSEGFRRACGDPPDGDGKLVRMWTATQDDLLYILQALERGGLKRTCCRDGSEHWLDMCVVDEHAGLTLPCDWIRVDLKNGLAELRDG
jgi:hypothetical protein